MASRRQKKFKKSKIGEVARGKLIDDTVQQAFDNKPDEDLFVIDTAPIPSREAKKFEKKRLLEEAKRSGVQFKLIEKIQKRKETENNKEHKTNKKQLVVKKKTEAIVDPWGNETQIVAQPKKLKRTKIESTKYCVPAVEIPASGTSYNPEVNEHQAALQNAVTREEEAKKKRMAHITKTLDFELDDMDEIENAEGFGDFGKREIVGYRNKTKRRERNRAIRRKALEAHVAKLKKRKEFLSEIDRTEEIEKEVLSEMVEKESKLEEKKRKIEEKFVLEEPAMKRGARPIDGKLQLDVALTEDVTGSLRTTVSDYNVTQDRFESLLKRNKFEIGRLKGKKKGKKKMLKNK
eukprot:TRINITY_DN683_c0_g1_i2.p1 TRINITY_DN683_c0_g1~~TRINITY_DN683_c0_g1_i2.p1  ORF type:complete len:362 (+),score=115.45 TRINITY_DN683_c0_g1_i2:45-1088(+)